MNRIEKEFRQIFQELWFFENLGILTCQQDISISIWAVVLWKFGHLTCQQDISKSIWARGLKFGQMKGDDE